jgi:hypothetical protein
MPTTTNERLAQINADSAATVSSRVSPTLHPDNIAPLGELLVDGGPSEAAYSAGRKALQSMSEAMVEIDSAHKSLLKPVARGGNSNMVEMIVPPERAAELASAMGQKASRTAAHVERCMQRVDQSIESLEQVISARTKHPRPSAPEVVQEAAEIRAYVKSLKEGTRNGFLHKAAEAGDLTVVSAVLNASPWISGITPDELSVLKMFARDAFAPKESKQADALRKVRASIEGGMSAFATQYHRLVPRVSEDKPAAALARLKAGA